MALSFGRPVLAPLLAVVLGLFPPGWLARHKAAPRDSVVQHLPATLAGGRVSSPRYRARALVQPVPARLGQRLTYRANVLAQQGVRVRFVRPEAGGAFTWGDPRAGHTSVGYSDIPGVGYVYADSFFVEAPIQVFSTGWIAIPGPQVMLESRTGKPTMGRLPTVHLLVMPSLTAADSNATLRPVRGPLVAPWWERVAWTWVALGAVALAGLVLLVRWLRRRARRPLPASAPAAAARPALDPGAEALAALARLRAEKLPSQGRYADHAYLLTRILRRYLEATVGGMRPGDTTPELLAHLPAGRIDPADVRRLEGLLGLWDRVKFARTPLAASEAERCENAVEQFVRQRAPSKEVA